MSKKLVELLRSDVVNQIAAGEVLESPASAVKELVENAMDAGASEVVVEVRGGGHQLIRVEDDGVGMGREDAVGCLERHATSKIREADDLWKLETMGFRGEALAAIAAVGQMEMETSDGEEATCVRVEAGRVLAVEGCARNRGTSIEVKGLFYNVPARQKFQKSAAGSAAQVLRLVQGMALAWPEVGFQLVSQERLAFRAKRQEGWRARVEEVLGPFAHEVKGEVEGAKVYGLLGAPKDAKGNRSGQYVFVNRRLIFSPVIARAVQDGYATRVMEGKYPTFVLFLEIAPGEVDVNVHPQKREVRFGDEGRIYRLVQRAVLEAFGPAPAGSFMQPLSFQPQPLPWDEEPKEVERREEQQVLEIRRERRVMAVMGSFALFEGEPFSLVDLKGAEARVLFEKMQRGGGGAQMLLAPVEIALSAGEAAHAEEWIEGLKGVGVEARFLGGRTVVIDALPAGLEAKEASEFFSQWKRERKAAAALCRICRSRKKVYSFEEAAWIERELNACADGMYDPLGRTIRKELFEEQILEWLSHAP